MRAKFSAVAAYVALALTGLLLIALPALFIIGSIALAKWSHGTL